MLPYLLSKYKPRLRYEYPGKYFGEAMTLEDLRIFVIKNDKVARIGILRCCMH